MRIGKDAANRIASHLEAKLRYWREKASKGESLSLPLHGRNPPEGSLCRERQEHGHVGLRRGGRVRLPQKVLAAEITLWEKGAAYPSSPRELLNRGLTEVHLAISNDHEEIKTAAFGKLPGPLESLSC